GTSLDRQPHATYSSLADLMRSEPPGFFIIGGEHIFGESLRYLPTRMFITVVNMNGIGDVRFPIIGQRFKNDHFVVDSTIYREEDRSAIMRENEIEFQFTMFKRQNAEVRN